MSSNARTGYSMRFGSALGGNNDAGGGVFEDLPIGAFTNLPAMTYFSDFTSAAEDGDYVATAVGVPASAGVTSGDLGLYVADTGATNDNGYGAIQLTASGAAGVGVAVPSANVGNDVYQQPTPRVIGFEARVAFSNPADCDWYIGLAAADTTFMTAIGLLTAPGADNMVGFNAPLILSAGVPLLLTNAGAGAQQGGVSRGAATIPLTANRFYRFGIRINGASEVQWFMDGLPVADKVVTTLPFSGGMTPTFAIMGNGASQTMSIDYVAVAQTR